MRVNTIYLSPVTSRSDWQGVLSTYYVLGTSVMVRAVNRIVSLHILGVRKHKKHIAREADSARPDVNSLGFGGLTVPATTIQFYCFSARAAIGSL